MANKRTPYTKEAFVIGLRRRNGIRCELPGKLLHTQLTSTFVAHILRYGYTVSPRTFHVLNKLDDFPYDVFIEALKEVKGDIKVQPMYPNFPKQVMEADYAELFSNAMHHYWTYGEWRPDYEIEEREEIEEAVDLVELVALFPKDFGYIFTSIAGSNNSISTDAKDTLRWFIENREDVGYTPDSFPFRENMCVIAALYKEYGRMIPRGMCNSAMDVLRIITYLNGGDISLATNTKFKSMPRKERRMWLEILEEVADQEDFHKEKEKFKRLIHGLHPEDYSPRITELIKPFRNNEKFRSFNSFTEEYINGKNWDALHAHLIKRPGMYVRRLNELIGKGMDLSYIVKLLETRADRISTRVLMQVLGWVLMRSDKRDFRMVMPKQPNGVVEFVNGFDEPLSPEIRKAIHDPIRAALISRWSSLEPLGKVYIDPSLAFAPIPDGMRSASVGTFEVARGTRFPIGNKTKTLRFFTHWIGQDIDLSAVLLDNNFQFIGNCLWFRNLREAGWGYHSGDETQAAKPNGSVEYIDIDIENLKLTIPRARWVVMDLRIFRGPSSFADHELCVAGWMERELPLSNEIFDPKTVRQKISLASLGKNVVVAAFDIANNEIIWLDVSTKNYHWGSTIETNSVEISRIVEGFANMTRPTLQWLFEIHAEARGEIVHTKEEADVIFGPDGEVKAEDVDIINHVYMT